MIGKSSQRQWSALALVVAVVLASTQTLMANEGNRRVQIRSKVLCSAKMVKLSDFVSNPEQLTDEELDLEVVETPMKTKTRRISLIGLAYMLQRYEQLHDLQIAGPNTIIVQRTASQKLLDDAKAAILDYVKKTAPWKDWKVDVLFNAGDTRQIADAAPFAKVKVHTVASPDRLGTVSFRLGFYDEADNVQRQVTINPLVVREVQAVVMRSSQPRGHILTNSDIQLAPMWLGRGKKEAVTDMREVVGRELSRPRNSGDMIRPADLLNPIGAKRGDLIWVTATKGRLSVRISVTALESGRVGQRIKVTNPSSRKEFSVELVGSKEAMMKL